MRDEEIIEALDKQMQEHPELIVKPDEDLVRLAEELVKDVDPR